MTTADVAKSIEAQIGEHMATWLADQPFVIEIRYISETTGNYGPFGTSVRTYLPEYSLEDSDRPRISVVPNGMQQVRLSRNMWQETYEIDTIVHQRLDNMLMPDYSGELPDQNVEARQADWRESVTSFGDAITKLADQIRMSFESRHCCGGGAPVEIPGLDDKLCAAWLRCQRSQIYERAQVEQTHVLFCVVRHVWLLHRQVMSYA